MFIFFLLLSLPLFSANDVSLYSNNETYMRRTDADFRTALPFNVNPITGEYCEVQTDLVVSGVQPISYRRFYGHFCDGDLANGHWSVNPESLVLFSLCSSEIEPFVGHGTADGGFYRFEHWKKNDRIELLDAKSYVHREISGGRHPANTVVEWDRSSPEPYFIFSGEIKRGDGTKISYESEYKAWPAIEVDPIARAMQTRLPPPFMAKVKRERLPNGNYLFYQYLDYAHNHTSDPAYYVLSHIVAVDSSMRVKLGEISIKYPKRMGPKNNHISKQVVISGSDGRIASYELELRTVIEKNSKRKHPYIFDLLLSSVERPDGADQSYQYGWKNKKGLKPQKKLAHYKKYALLERSVTEDGMPIRIEYGAGRRVERIYGPGDMIVASYVYGHGYTVVTDGAGNHTIYRYDKNKRVYEVETADAIHKSKWSELGDLLSKSICDKGGCELSKTTYKYDVHHNRIEESFAGTTIFREFDDNNRIIERREGAKRTIYEYEDNRDLITYEALFDGAKELSWTKNRYDYAACLIRTEHFDGKHRRIKKIQPRRTLPNYGLPEVVEEFDEEESLIQKRVYLYTPAGKISSERHYDAHGSLCYTISNEYDEKENLILTIDAEGNETRYSYDDRGNQIEKVLGNQQIITIYDAANRPIEVHDGDLVTYKSYNPAGQLISMTKPSGYKELYSYDASGRLFRTDYADGTFESLEYDPLGNVVKRRDRNGFVTSTEYNERSLPVEVKHPDGGCESFVYDEYGRLISSTDRHGMETTYSYNICDQLISKSQGDRRYHAVYEGPLLIEEEEFSGIKSSYVYNILGQKVEETKGGRRAFFYYDARGRLSHRVAGDSVYVFEYDNLDRVVRKKRVAHDRAWNEVSYRFDECGRLIWEESSRGIFERFYNGQGQLIMEVDQLGQCTESSYRNGLLVAKRLPSGVTTHMEYDSCDRVSLIYKTDPSGRKCSMTKKAYDGRGNCVR
ncbi:MAG: hypothetical protein K0U13_00515, partial [Chlamydiae bacterium]|nr:hypothetical protein [Chlamydiota bacterium]